MDQKEKPYTNKNVRKLIPQYPAASEQWRNGGFAAQLNKIAIIEDKHLL